VPSSAHNRDQLFITANNRRRRYKYLQDAAGRFHNPFNHSCCTNCAEAFAPDAVPVAPVMLPRDPDSLLQLGLVPPPRV
jgi:hypothetical protein